MDLPLPWERLLWRGRSLSPRPLRHALTDLRLVSLSRDTFTEITIDDIADVRHHTSRLWRLAGVSTVVVHARDSRRPPIVLPRIRHGEQLAALIDLLSTGAREAVDADAARAVLAPAPWRATPRALRMRLAAALVVLAAGAGLLVALHGGAAPAAYAADDAISPGGTRRAQQDIVRFMETAVMPWARDALGPIAGGRERVTCDTCHGGEASAHAWRMPGVAALPKPNVTALGWELYGGAMDTQMRNAIYGYGAASDNQAKAAYMREIVMPGMARLLHRPVYDFTRTYDYNRTHAAFGCYHCHRVGETG